MQVNVENIFTNVSQATTLKKLCDVRGPLVNVAFLPGCFMLFILLFVMSMEGSPLLHEAR
jgi:hypothetical protein